MIIFSEINIIADYINAIFLKSGKNIVDTIQIKRENHVDINIQTDNGKQ